MSTTSLDEAPATPPVDAPPTIADAPAPGVALAAPLADAPPARRPAEPGVRTFRGRTLEELLPQIREQLGPDAVVVRQRDGLMGGVGGFFQQRFVEVDAKGGPAHPSPHRHPRVDVYDEQPPETPESFARLLADAEAHADPVVTAAAFAPPVGASEPANPEPAGLPAAGLPAAEPTPAREPVPAVAPSAPPLAADPARQLAAELQQAGMSASFAERLLADAEAHELPFTRGDLRTATRRALARRIPTSMPHRAGGLAVAFAGPGSTSCADALATAYVRAGRRALAVATVEQARTRLERGNPGAVLALDLPPIASDRHEVEALAARVAAVELDETLIVLPADLDLPSARALHERLAPLAPTGVALACEHPTSPPGAAIELACTTRLPLAYVLDAAGPTIAPADATALAERLLP
ncbi:MAG TPA: hypothetical protein VFF79_02255 [Conexibacter sp.]|jgi:hypothetical protein|nr:hypothetical protein [Conexibacter sp.]